MRGSPYDVIVCDLFNIHTPDHETIVAGFPTRELAIQYARRRTWSSVDDMREPGRLVEHIRNQWLALGEDCRVVGPGGGHARLAVHLLPRDEHITIHQIIRSIVPDIVWKGLETRRQRYITSAYSEGRE